MRVVHRFFLVVFGVVLTLGLGALARPDGHARPQHNPHPAPLGVLTFNIRYANPADGDNAWPKRKDWVAEILRDERLGVIGIQEALKPQVDDLRAACPKLGVVGVGRDDGKDKGEFAPILYRTDQWTVEKSGTFWLSEKPEEPGSKSWKTACTRICTWARMRPTAEKKATDATGANGGFWMFNTHLDHQSAEARTKGAELIAARIAELTAVDPAPVIVTGDLNAGESDPATRVFTGAADAARRLSDTLRAAHPDEKDAGTFNSFDAARRGGDKIDYVLVSDGIKTMDAWIDRRTRDGRAPSDHWPVGAVIVLPVPAR